MKNENTSFGFLTAIIVAGVIAACVRSDNASDVAGENSGLSGLTAYIANAGSASINDIATANPATDQAAEVLPTDLNPSS